MRGPVGVRGPHGAGRMPRRRGAAAVRTVPAAQRAEGGPRTPGAAWAAEAQRPVAAWRSPTARVGPAAPWVPTAGRSMGPSPVDPGRWARPRAAGAGRAVPSPSPAVGGTGPMAAVPRLRVAPAPESPGHGRVTRPGSRAPEPDHHGGTAPPGALRVSEGSNPASRGVSQPVDLRPPAGLRPRRGADLAPPPRPAPPKPSPRGRHPQQLTLRSRTREEARPGRSCRRGSPPALVFPTWEVPGRTDRPRPGSEGRDPPVAGAPSERAGDRRAPEPRPGHRPGCGASRSAWEPPTECQRGSPTPQGPEGRTRRVGSRRRGLHRTASGPGRRGQRPPRPGLRRVGRSPD
jgi:hypothetical protein